MINRHEASLNMLEGQLKPNGITCTKVIQTILEIDRSLFIPEKYHNIAFSDVDIPLYDTYSIPKPLLASKLLQEMDLKKSDKVLEVGTGSGYLTACIAKNVKEVVTIDINEGLINKAKSLHANLSFHNITYKCVDVFSSLDLIEKFDKILIDASCNDKVLKLKELLNINGLMVYFYGLPPISNLIVSKKVSENQFIDSNPFECFREPLTDNGYVKKLDF